MKVCLLIIESSVMLRGGDGGGDSREGAYFKPVKTQQWKVCQATTSRRVQVEGPDQSLGLRQQDFMLLL